MQSEMAAVKADRSLLDMIGIIGRHLDSLEAVITYGGCPQPNDGAVARERELVTPERSFEDKLSAVDDGLNGIDNRIKAITERLASGMVRI